jgi:hypothetical protein
MGSLIVFRNATRSQKTLNLKKALFIFGHDL